MDNYVLDAVRIIFIVATIAPPLLVILYRMLQVPLRRADVEKMMKCAFDASDKDSCKAILDNNPYISDPKLTFESYHSGWRYVIPLLLLSVLTASSTYIVYSSVRHHLFLHAANIAGASKTVQPTATPAQSTTAAPSQQKGTEIVPDVVPSFVMIMALTGGYIWSLYQICARSRSSELSPDDLYEINLGMLAAVPVGIAFSLMTESLGDVRSFAAFAASAFPLRDVSRMIRQYATRKALQSADAADSTSRPAELHLGTSIEGLSDQNLARLSELRITTVLDMAYCDPIKVMVQTGFPLPVIIDWVDQSLWALYAGDLKSKIDKRGIRCSLDVCEFVDLHLRDSSGKKKVVIEGADKEALDAFSKEMNDCQPVLLQDLLFRIEADPQVVVLRKLWYPTGVPVDLKALAAGTGN